MTDDSLLVLNGRTVHDALIGRETSVVDAVARAYRAHALANTALPHSVFLRFPNAASNRIIALPAYLGEDWDVAGVKWISSFPSNIDQSKDRASAIMVLNSAQTGYPFAVLEASQISAQRTAASAALAARYLWTSIDNGTVAVIGCGLIAHETLRYLDRTVQPIETLRLHDLAPARAHRFKDVCEAVFPKARVRKAESFDDAVRGAGLVLFATTASTPYVLDPALFARGATVLHVSLRDLAPSVILAGDNIVADVDHVCRADTSIHLTEQRQGNRAFIRTTLADVVAGIATGRRTPEDLVIFSPFGLGILDLAVAHFVVAEARASDAGVHIPSFLPPPWRSAPPHVR